MVSLDVWLPKGRVVDDIEFHVFAPRQLLPDAVSTDSDILDIAVVDFSDEIGPAFFKDPPYIINKETARMANRGD